jgi:hypothetical protein
VHGQRTCLVSLPAALACAWTDLAYMFILVRPLLQVRMAFDWAYCQLSAPVEEGASLLQRVIRCVCERHRRRRGKGGSNMTVVLH